MSMCRVFSCVVGRGCLLWPVCSLGKTLLAFALLHSILRGQIACYSRYFLTSYFCIPVPYNDGEGNGTPLQYSCLENPMDGGAWYAAVHGVAKIRTWLSDFTFHFSLSCTGEGNGNPLQCSCLENPRDGRAWWAAVSGVAQSRTWLKWLSSSMKTYKTF